MMAVFSHSTADQMGIAISPGESFNLLASSLGAGPIGITDQHLTKPYRSGLPPAVVNVPAEHIRGYVHNKKVNHYLVGSNLGEGSFAKVKEAFHVLVGEKVAMKVIDKKKAMQDPYVAKNFKREAKLLQMVRHPNILQLLEVIETESSFYLITELCTGGELMRYIYKKGQLDEAETRKFMRQIVSAVDHMHKAGIIHRDLKVENMLLDSNMDIKLIDFGLSNEEYVQGENGLMHCSTQCGSPAYAAPELLGHKPYGPQVDIWSIGVNMYAMLTGCLPYTVEPFNITALHAKMLENKMNPIPSHLSETCKDLLKQLLRSNPNERLGMPGIMSHPWMNEGRTLLFGPAPFPNKLQLTDINADIVQHMVCVLKVKDVEEELVQELVSNRSTQAGAIYYLLLARLARYNKHFPRARHKPKVSRDQGFFEGSEEDLEASSIKSLPARKPSRYSKTPLRTDRPGGGKHRPISYPTTMLTEEAGNSTQQPQDFPVGFNFSRRKSMPEFMLNGDVAKAQGSHERKKSGRAMDLPQESPSKQQATRPTTQAGETRTKRHTHPPSEPIFHQYDPDQADTVLRPVRPPKSMRKKHYSIPALNQIREDLTTKLPPSSTGGFSRNAWYSNPSSQNASRNPSRHGSRQPSGKVGRNAPIHNRSGSLDEDLSSVHQDELVFHDVKSSTLPRASSRKKLFSVGHDPADEDSFPDHGHLPSILEKDTSMAPHQRKRAFSDALPEKRNGFTSSQIKVVDVRTDLGINEVITEITRVAQNLKMRITEQIGSTVMLVSKDTRFQVTIGRGSSTVCRLTYHLLSGDLQTYKEKSDKLSRKIKL